MPIVGLCYTVYVYFKIRKVFNAILNRFPILILYFGTLSIKFFYRCTFHVEIRTFNRYIIICHNLQNVQYSGNDNCIVIITYQKQINDRCVSQHITRRCSSIRHHNYIDNTTNGCGLWVKNSNKRSCCNLT